VVGTQITDNLVDNFGVTLVTTTIIFTVALAAVFATWYASEKTLSIHTIYTTRRETFYWLAILFTFALGTAAGDLTAERLNVGYLNSALLFAAMIAAVTITHYVVKAVLGAEHRRQVSSAVLAFWLAYILTRPLGASIGDFLANPVIADGLGWGTVNTSLVFLAAILLLVVYLTISKADRIEQVTAKA
jgi:uncharacterized membrane-anchored protein